MKQKLFLTIDLGTQSVRVSFINPKGEVVALKKSRYRIPYFAMEPGFAEIDPNVYMKYIGKAYRELIKEHNLIDDVIGVAITYFRDSVVVAKDDMVPLRPAILWLDQRRAKNIEKLPLLNRVAFKLAGVGDLIRLNRMRTPAHWIKENEPKIWSQVTRYMNLSTYINYKFTGEYKDSDANSIGHMPVDYKHRRWCKSNNDLTGMIYGVDINTLCEMVPADVPIGRITKEASKITGIKEGLPFYAVGSDKGCETFGLGAFKNNVGAVSFGTSATIQTTNKKYVTPRPLFPAYPSVIPGYFNTETMINKGYWMLTWFVQQFCEKQKEIALKVAKVSGMPWCAVDIMPLVKGSNDDFKEFDYNVVLEYNASPGSDGISAVIGHNFMKLLLDNINNINELVLAPKAIGYIENVTFTMHNGDEIEFEAKFDTGNGAKASTIGCDAIKDNGKTLTATINGKNYTFDKVGVSKAIVGQVTEERNTVLVPCIKVGSRKLLDAEFALVDNRNKKQKVLLNRDLMAKMAYQINPAKKHLLVDEFADLKVVDEENKK